jgi:hypothetical protein
MSNTNLAWVVIPTLNDEETQSNINISLVDSNLNIQYNNTFSYPIPNINNLSYTAAPSNQSNAIIDSNNNLIYAIISFSESTINIYKASILNECQEFKINIDIPSLNIWTKNDGTSSYDVSTNINLLSNNNYLITLIVNFNGDENAKIFYYILDKNFNLITKGNTQYNGQPTGQQVPISISDNRINIGYTIYDNNFNIINPKINIESIDNVATRLSHIYGFSLQYVNNYSLMLLILIDNSSGNNIFTVYAILGDLNGNILYYIKLPTTTNYFTPYLLLNYLSDNLTTYLMSNSNNELTIYQLNFKTQSSNILYTFSNITSLNNILYNYQYNMIYAIMPINSLSIYLPEMESNKSNIPLTGNPAILSNGQLMKFNRFYGTLNLYNYTFNLIKSKKFNYPNYLSYLEIIIVPLPYSQNNFQKNMNIKYNPLLCKMYTANEILELS